MKLTLAALLHESVKPAISIPFNLKMLIFEVCSVQGTSPELLSLHHLLLPIRKTTENILEELNKKIFSSQLSQKAKKLFKPCTFPLAHLRNYYKFEGMSSSVLLLPCCITNLIGIRIHHSLARLGVTYTFSEIEEIPVCILNSLGSPSRSMILPNCADLLQMSSAVCCWCSYPNAYVTDCLSYVGKHHLQEEGCGDVQNKKQHDPLNQGGTVQHFHIWIIRVDSFSFYYYSSGKVEP